MRAGGRRLDAEVYAAARGPVEPPPLGEDGRELTGADAISAAHDALLTVTTPANLTLAVKAISTMHIRRVKRVAVFVTFTDGSMVTLRIKVDRLRQLSDQLLKALAR